MPPEAQEAEAILERTRETDRGPTVTQDPHTVSPSGAAGPHVPRASEGHDAGDRGLLEAETEQFEHEVRRVAAGGWRRAATATALGAAAGLAALLGLPRDEPRARS